MKILSIDSSAIVATVALCEGEKLLAEYTVKNGNTHSETLLPMIESIFKNFGISVKDIDIFAASSGPGSFTGVRIGAATLKGLAFGSGKPCIGVSTLEAIAENLIMHKGLICSVMNARRSQVYTALFISNGKELTRLMPDSAISIEELDSILAQKHESICFCGDGYNITTEALKQTKYIYVPDKLRNQSAYSVAQVAYRKYLLGEYSSDREFTVTYLRPSQAERTYLENKQKNI